jgi:hypothetical protein
MPKPAKPALADSTEEHGVEGANEGANIDGTFLTVVVPGVFVLYVIACDGEACTPT